jgi:hypothetical protein
MQSVQRIGRGVATQLLSNRASNRVPGPAPEPQPVHALMRLAPPPPQAERRDYGRPAAAFLAQLIANEENLPQARARCRAAPRDAIAAYQATAARR